MIEVFISLIAILGCVLFLYFKRTLSYFKRNNVPYFDADPIFGHFRDLMLIRTSPADVVEKIYNHKSLANKAYGGVFILQKPGLFVKDIDLIKRILITDSNKFSDHYADTHQGDSIGINNMFLSKGHKWKQIRRKMVQAYTSGRIKNMFNLIDDVGQQLDKHLSALFLEEDTKSRSTEIKPITSSYTMDVIATTAFGIEANTLNNPDAEFYKYGKHIFDFNWIRALEFNAIFFVPKLVPFIRAKFFGNKADKFLKDIYKFVMKERLKSGVYRNDLIDILIDLKKANSSEDCDYYFTDDALLSQAATFFSAGFETSSQTMTFALYELAKHPEIQTKLREEIRNILRKNNGKLSYDVVNGLEYLTMIIKETLRLYPVLPFLDRISTFENKDEEYSLEPFGEYKVKHGMPIFIPVYPIHRNPKYFPEPNKFDPERFSPENKDTVQSGTFFPFGGGPRTCIGERIALLTSKIGLIYFLKNHYFRLNNKSHKEMKLSKSALLVQSEGEVFLEVFKDPM